MIKQKFEFPEMEMIEIGVTDVIATSGEGLTSSQAPLTPEILDELLAGN